MPSILGSLVTRKTLVGSDLGKVSRSFKDISFNFSNNPITNDVVVLKNEEAIKQSVKNLILTKIGERPFNPYLGTDTTSYLFELSSAVSANSLIEEIEKVLIENEPRIRLVKIDVDIQEDGNNYEVVIEYNIVGLPEEVQTISFILVRES